MELAGSGLSRFELVSANHATCLSANTMLMEIPITSQELIIDVDEMFHCSCKNNLCHFRNDTYLFKWSPGLESCIIPDI